MADRAETGRLSYVAAEYPAVTEQHIRATEAYIQEWDIPGSIPLLLFNSAIVNVAVDWWNGGAPNNPASARPTPGGEALANFDAYLAAGGQMPAGVTVDEYREVWVRNDWVNRARLREQEARNARWSAATGYSAWDLARTKQVVKSLNTTVRVPSRLEHLGEEQLPGVDDPRLWVFRQYMRQVLGWTVVGMVTHQLLNDAVDWWNVKRRRLADA